MLRKNTTPSPAELYELTSEKPLWFTAGLHGVQGIYVVHKGIEKKYKKCIADKQHTPIEKRLDDQYFTECSKLLTEYRAAPELNPLLRSLCGILLRDRSILHGRDTSLYFKWCLNKDVELSDEDNEKIMSASINHYMLLILIKSLIFNNDELTNDTQRIILLNEVLTQLTDQASLLNKDSQKNMLIDNCRRSLLCNVLAMQIMSAKGDEPDAVIRYASFAKDAASSLQKFIDLTYIESQFVSECDANLVRLQYRRNYEAIQYAETEDVTFPKWKQEDVSALSDSKDDSYVANVQVDDENNASLFSSSWILLNLSSLRNKISGDVTPVVENYRPSPANERTNLAILYQPSYIENYEPVIKNQSEKSEAASINPPLTSLCNSSYLKNA